MRVVDSSFFAKALLTTNLVVIVWSYRGVISDSWEEGEFLHHSSFIRYGSLIVMICCIVLTGCSVKQSSTETEAVEAKDSTFEDYTNISSGFFYERSETQFDDVITYDLTKEDIEQVKAALAVAVVNRDVEVTFDSDSYHYQLYLYDENGDILYWFFLNSDDVISYDGYELESEESEQWLNELVETQRNGD